MKKKVMIPEFLEMIVMKKQLDIIMLREHQMTGVWTDPVYLWCG